MRVLVVDDEPRYRVYLSAKLGSLGHQVAVAETGRQAIERGLRFLPSVLVSDWMLRNHVHGLHVVDALRAVDSALPAILMTGFPSRDLRAQAKSAQVLVFLEKPFDLADLVAAVERAAAARRRTRPHVAFGVITTRGELCVHASERAVDMLASTEAGGAASRLDAIFGPEPLAALRAEHEWTLVAPRARGRVRWWAHWKREGENGVLGILPERKPFLRNDTALRMLLSLPPVSGTTAPRSKLLVVDAMPISAVRYPEQLERMGWACVKAESAELALRLLAEDPELGAVVVDRSVPDLDLAAFVEQVRRLRPAAAIVGASARLADHLDFEALRVSRFLQVPWRVGDLLHVLDQPG
jgi:DNA-binding NtrC family response regulator